MAARAGVHLYRACARGTDAFGIEKGLLIAFDDSHVTIGGEVADRSLEECGLARSGGTGDVQRKDLAFAQPLSVVIGDEVVLRQHLLFQGDRRGVDMALVAAVVVGVSRGCWRWSWWPAYG